MKSLTTDSDDLRRGRLPSCSSLPSVVTDVTGRSCDWDLRFSRDMRRSWMVSLRMLSRSASRRDAESGPGAAF